MKNNISIALLVSVSIIFVYGNQNPQWKGTIEEEDGVKVIKNPNEPLYGEITFELEEDLSIGNEEDENYAFYRATVDGVDSDGNIFVLDRGNYRVQKYDKDGKYLQSIGRQGQGPGEFEMPFTLWMDANDNIYVWDMQRRKIQKFAKNGNFINSIKSEMSPGNFGITTEGNLIAQTLSRGERKSDMPMDSDLFFNLDLISQEGTTIKTIASYPKEQSERIKHERGYLSPNNLCTPRLCLCPVNEDLAIYGYSIDYSLFAINAKGETVYVIKKDESPQPITKAEKEKVIDRFTKGRKEDTRMPQISRSKYASALRFPKHKPFYEGIIKDDKDRIYVKKFEFIFNRSDISNFDIFSQDGYYLYKSKVPVQNPSVVRSGYIYKTEFAQETGYFKVKRYKIKNWEQIRAGL